jgi:hypothetical protein
VSKTAKDRDEALQDALREAESARSAIEDAVYAIRDAQKIKDDDSEDGVLASQEDLPPALDGVEDDGGVV